MRSSVAIALAGGLLFLVVGCRAAAPAAASDGGGATEAVPHDEAGFVDVPPQPDGAPYPARMFYVFEAADADPANKPLVVFFNGGPGYATSLGLLAYGTARATLDPTASGAPANPDPTSWTSFANLLYVDERQTGFSYGLTSAVGAGSGGGAAADGAAGDDAGACTFSPEGDAADFVRVVLRFLDGHAALRAAPVVLVGLSYGGERATLALDLLLQTARGATRIDAALGAAIQAHYDAVFPDHPGSPPPELAASQFGHAVLIQPLLFNAYQFDVQASLAPADPYVGQVPADRDPYDVREAQGWADARNDAAAAAYADPVAAPALLGADPRTIPGLGPSARASAFRLPGEAVSPGVAAANAALRAALGPLAGGDDYLRNAVPACPNAPLDTTDLTVTEAFARNLVAGVRTFVTDARYDAVVYAPAIPATLAQWVPVTRDSAPRTGVDRPGWFSVSLSTPSGARTFEVRFPPYDGSGHMVNITEPQPLHDDVAAWLEGEGGP